MSDDGERSEIPTVQAPNRIEFAGPIPQPAEATDDDGDDGETHRLLPFPAEPTEPDPTGDV